MAFESTRRDVGIAPTAPAFWNNPSVRAIAYQVLLVGGVIAVGAYLVHNTLVNLERQGIATGFGFLNREAAFEIGESLIPYTPADTYGRALLVGLLNTLCVAGIGIVLATILGTIIGIARLSTNWLISKLASFYVETVRNIPVLLQLIVCREFSALLGGLVSYPGAFTADIARPGTLAVSWGQPEAAMALGLRRALALRLAGLPQAVRVIVPPMTSQYLNLTKNSSLAVAI